LNALAKHDALGLAELVRAGEISPAELLDQAIANAESVNPEINAITRPMYDEARATVEAGVPEGQFTGVPFLLKDLRASYAGVPTTAGSRFLANAVAAQDSELVARYKRSGLVIFGKTNTPEYGCCPSTESAMNGPTHNPWRTGFSAGGSSGGASAAVAARIVPAAHGSDGGGSIRIPASCCGVFGFKPSRGMLPAGPEYGEAWNGLSAEHVLTVSVRDSAAMLDISRGPEPGDPYRGATFDRPMLDEVGAPAGKLRIGVQREALSGAPVHADCIAALDDTVALLEDLGHHVEEAVPSYDFENMGPAFTLLIAANVQGMIDQHIQATGHEPGEDDIEPVIRILAEIGHQQTAADMARAIWTMHRVGRQVAPFFDEYDALLSPVTATPPPPLGTLNTNSTDVEAYVKAVFEFIPFTALANQAGIPGMSVPLYWTESGLPLGAHFMAGFGRDDLLFRLAAQLEEARPWAGRTPPICAD
jgi:Asp-tRNA(Asn)/Glu-tRNA(Gln) amidotransferase A subunit family amidase